MPISKCILITKCTIPIGTFIYLEWIREAASLACINNLHSITYHVYIILLVLHISLFSLNPLLMKVYSNDFNTMNHLSYHVSDRLYTPPVL